MLFWGNAKSKNETVTNGDRDSVLAVVVLDAAQMFLLLGLTVYHFQLKKKVNDAVDVNTITIDDYAVEVRGLPENATELSVKNHALTIKSKTTKSLNIQHDKLYVL